MVANFLHHPARHGPAASQTLAGRATLQRLAAMFSECPKAGGGDKEVWPTKVQSSKRPVFFWVTHGKTVTSTRI